MGNFKLLPGDKPLCFPSRCDGIASKMFFRNLLCLIIGVVIGVRLTDFWDYVKIQNLYGGDKYPNIGINDDLSTGNQKITIDDAVQPGRINISLGDFLFNGTRVLCWIMTTPENHLKRALQIKYTWGIRCNKLLFMSTENDHLLGTVALPVPEGRTNLWEKTRRAFRYVYDNHFNDADWFLKADDDTYVIMENLRSFLYQYSPESPVYFGCKFHPFVEQGYMSGGAGYVLSKEALRRFAEISYNNTTLCSQNKLSEDKEMGICLQNVGVVAGDSRDQEGRERFIPLAPVHLIPIDTSEWYSQYLFYRSNGNGPCCSRHAISFHYIKPKEFYILEYLLYRLRPFGLPGNIMDILPPKANMTQVMKKWRTDISNNIFQSPIHF